MPSHADKLALLEHVNALVEFQAHAITASGGERGEVVIARRGHVLGLWRCERGLLTWTPAGYGEAVHKASSLEAALTFIRSVTLADPGPNAR